MQTGLCKKMNSNEAGALMVISKLITCYSMFSVQCVNVGQGEVKGQHYLRLSSFMLLEDLCLHNITLAS